MDAKIDMTTRDGVRPRPGGTSLVAPGRPVGVVMLWAPGVTWTRAVASASESGRCSRTAAVASAAASMSYSLRSRWLRWWLVG